MAWQGQVARACRCVWRYIEHLFSANLWLPYVFCGGDFQGRGEPLLSFFEMQVS